MASAGVLGLAIGSFTCGKIITYGRHKAYKIACILSLIGVLMV